tara:strand:+ start:197 stop:379 length:183 start_codon:yes stop_codon:yes gene_type:complete
VDKQHIVDIRLEVLKLCMESSSLKVQENPIEKADMLVKWVLNEGQHKPKKKVVDTEVIET